MVFAKSHYKFLKGTGAVSVVVSPYLRIQTTPNQIDILEEIGFNLDSVEGLYCDSWVTDGSLTYDINGLNKLNNITRISLIRNYIDSLSPLIRSY